MKPKLRATTYAYVVEVEREIGTYEVAVSVHTFGRTRSVHCHLLSGPDRNLFEFIFGVALPDDVRKEAVDLVLEAELEDIMCSE